MIKEMRDYRQDIKINEFELEQEWIEQASLFLYYAEAHVEALHISDLKKVEGLGTEILKKLLPRLQGWVPRPISTMSQGNNSSFDPSQNEKEAAERRKVFILFMLFYFMLFMLFYVVLCYFMLFFFKTKL